MIKKNMSVARSKNNFQVIGSKIYDPNGEEFIIKGTNMFTWEGNTQVNSIVNQWKFNTVRVPNYLLGSYGQLSPQLDGYATNGAIADSFTS
jgi:mannan endo-1,4-beta-mannosidase